MRGKSKVHMEAKIIAMKHDLSYEEMYEILIHLFWEHDVLVRATAELGGRKQCDAKGVTEFISALQRLAMKAFPMSDATAKRHIMEHLKKGLKCPFTQQYVKTKMMKNEATMIEEIKDVLCTMDMVMRRMLMPIPLE